MPDGRDLARRAVQAGLLARLAREPPQAPVRYELDRCLGRGGGGAVWLARDRDLGRRVALKFLGGFRPLEAERFFREARFAARLNAPGIVQVYDACESGGVPFIAMQYVDGGNFAVADLDIPATVAVARQVAEALSHAHRAGIVHRDIKPENILLDGERRAYVTDFGIARDMKGELGATISAEGQIMGTPALMPPEQARGDVHAIDERSDVYALGATLYTKLTGRWPFKGDNLLNVIHTVLQYEPPFQRRHNQTTPQALEALVLRCMRKRREDRYRSMEEVARALQDSTSGEGLSTPWFASFVRSTVENAPQPRTDESAGDADLAAALQAAREITEWDRDLYRIRSNLPRHFPRLDRLAARMDRVLEERPGAGWARFYRGVARFRRGDIAGALEDMERSIDRVRHLPESYFELGRLYLAAYLREHDRARRHLSREGTDWQLKSARSRLEQADLAFAEARRLERGLPEWQARFAEAVAKLAEGDHAACAEACAAILEEDPDREEVWKLRGDALARMGEDPLESYRRAVDVRRSYFDAWLAAGEYLLDRGEVAAARRWLEQALDVHPGHAGVRVILARACLDDGDAPCAVETAEQALAADPKSYDAAVLLAEARIEAGDAAGALEALEAASTLDGCQNRVGFLRARAWLVRARGLRAAGRHADADIDRVLALREQPGAQVSDNRPWLDLFAEAERLRDGA